MKKIALSLTDQNVEWLSAEAARRGLAVSDLIRHVIDDAASAAAQALIRCEEDILNKVLDAGFMFKAMLEVPEPAGENRCSYVLKPVREMTVAEATLAF